MKYVVKYRYPRKFNGKIQTLKFKEGHTAFKIWLKEASPTIQIISQRYER